MSRLKITIAGGDTATPLNLSIRLNLIKQYIIPGVSKVLDGGCGEGEYVLALRRKYNVEAWGIDYLERKINSFKSKHPKLNWVSRGNLHDIGYDNSTFDVVILNEVLEHVPNEITVLEEIHRVLRPYGKILIFSPNRLFPFESHGVLMRNSGKKVPPYIPMIPYIPLFIGNKIFRYWARNYWPTELQRLIKKAGFDIIESTYLWQTFENISGTQPAFMRKSKFLLRKTARILERTPLLKAFGVSQVIVAQRGPVRKS